MEIETIAQIVSGLVGFPALLAALINLAKSLGFLPDGQAGNVNLMAHLVAYAGVGVAVLLGKVDILPELDIQLGAIANSLLIILAFLSSVGISKGFHRRVLRDVPVVGFSYWD